MLTILQGHALDKLAELPDESAQCCITSPPYWGLRSYGTKPQTWPDDWRGELGNEPTPDLYVAHLVEVFRAVRRVLRKDGTVWLNLGDSYAGGGGFSPDAPSNRAGSKQASMRGAPGAKGLPVTSGLKAKDLIGIPWRVAFALQADGWWLRSDIIWHKPNPMPESVTDRPTKAHEYLFLLAKSERYYYDAESIKEPATYAGKMVTLGAKSLSRGQAAGAGISPSGNGTATSVVVADGRNCRSVWTVTTNSFPEAHFATFPPNLVKPCVLAGCPVGGTVLDPFLGSGTTAMVALELGRKAVGIELNPAYVEMAERRCHITPGLPMA